MAWMVHKPADYLLGQTAQGRLKEEAAEGQLAIFAAAAETRVNPQFAVLIASIANLED